MKSKLRIPVLAFVLVLVLVFTCLSLVACDGGNAGDTSTTANTSADSTTGSTGDVPSAPVKLNLVDYTIVYPKSWDDAGQKNMKNFASAIEKITGGYAARMDDSGAVGEKEILLGATNRPESQKALEGLDLNTFV